jgi:hypothetical protein
MTQAALKTFIYRLRCCSGDLAVEIANQLKWGDKVCKFNNLMLLNDSIDYLLKYDVSEEAINCITESQFEDMIDRTKNICKLCDCE